MDRPPVDLARSSLHFDIDASPERSAAQIVAAFETAAAMSNRVGWVHDAISATIGPATDADADAGARAVEAAGTAIAASIDADAAFYDRHPYHNRQHFCEVMLTAHFLCRQHRLPTARARLVLLAALIHDIEHDGLPDGRLFEFERRSIERAAPFLAASGVDALTRTRLEALVIATEPRRGVGVAVAAHRWHLGGRTVPMSDAGPPELRPLATDAELAWSAVLLCEADVLPSVGLSFAHGMQLQDRLSREWGHALTPVDKARFLDAVLAAGVVDAFFLPNVHAMQRTLAKARGAGPR